MKKLFNSPETMVDDMLDGFVSAFAQVQRGSRDPRVIKRAINAKNPDEKVTLLIGNGSGHEPIAMGFVGQGVLDAIRRITVRHIQAGAGRTGRGKTCSGGRRNAQIAGRSRAYRFGLVRGRQTRRGYRRTHHEQCQGNCRLSVGKMTGAANSDRA